jgi:hypothetical protein
VGYGAFFLDEELLLARPAGEGGLGPKRQGDVVKIFVFSGNRHLKGHWHALVAATVLARNFSGSTHGQDPSLDKGNIANGLTFAGEVELLFFLAWVFGHGGIIGYGRGVLNRGHQVTTLEVPSEQLLYGLCKARKTATLPMSSGSLTRLCI